MAVRGVTEAEKGRVSAVVVNYNAGPLLIPCVSGMMAQGVGEVVVVDNASSDSSLAMLRNALAGNRRLHVIGSDENLGFAMGCNVGVRASSGEYVLFLNPDARLEEV